MCFEQEDNQPAGAALPSSRLAGWSTSLHRRSNEENRPRQHSSAMQGKLRSGSVGTGSSSTTMRAGAGSLVREKLTPSTFNVHAERITTFTESNKLPDF
jgi:hypothetical protein